MKTIFIKVSGAVPWLALTALCTLVTVLCLDIHPQFQQKQAMETQHYPCASYSLIKWMEKEEKSISVFSRFSSNNYSHMVKLVPFLNEMILANISHDYHNSRNRSMHYIEHPVNAYSMIRRWAKLRQLTKEEEKPYGVLWPGLQILNVPTQEDYEMALAAILKIQKVYRLKVSDIVAGIINGVHSPHRIPLNDSFDFCNVAMAQGEYGQAIQWLEYALSQESVKNGLTTNDLIYHYTILVSLYNQLQNPLATFKYVSKILNYVPNNQNMLDLYHKFENQLSKLPEGYIPKYTPENWRKKTPEVEMTYEDLCRQDVENVKPVNKLFCRMQQSKTVPVIFYKEEIVYDNPRIVIYHDIITDMEAYTMYKQALPNMNREYLEDEMKKFTHIRFAKVGGVNDKQSKYIASVSRRLSDVTGLNHYHFALDPYQLLNYGMAGHYDPHYDVSLKQSKSWRNSERMSTFLFYLTKPKVGGATVFPKLGLHVSPVRNAVLFWHNLKTNGDVDTRMIYGECPVLIGAKWTAHRWFMERGQEFIRKCLPQDSV